MWFGKPPGIRSNISVIIHDSFYQNIYYGYFILSEKVTDKDCNIALNPWLKANKIEKVAKRRKSPAGSVVTSAVWRVFQMRMLKNRVKLGYFTWYKVGYLVVKGTSVFQTATLGSGLTGWAVAFVLACAQFLLAGSLWKWMGASDWLLSVLTQKRSTFAMKVWFNSNYISHWMTY